jgi:hypothetical protein
MKVYSFQDIYRGQQIVKKVCANSIKDVSFILGISHYTAKKFCLYHKTDDLFEGVRAYIDGGNLCKIYFKKEMPWNELKYIIDLLKDMGNAEFEKKLRIKI